MSDTPSANLKLFDRQIEVLNSKVDELLIGGPGCTCGSSFILRAVGIISAYSNPGILALLGMQDESSVRKVHIEDKENEAGLLNLVAEMQKAGACVVTPTELRFTGGGILRWTGLAREVELRAATAKRVDVLLLDNVEELPEATYDRLRNHTMSSPHPARRIVCACTKQGTAGWVDSHWGRVVVPGRGTLAMSSADVDASMIVVPKQQSYREWIEKVQGSWFRWPRHVEHIVDAIDRWIRGEWEHLAIHIPAQHCKTETGPRNAIPYILSLYPSDWCSIVSYGSDLAKDRSEDARDYYQTSGGELKENRSRADNWHIQGGGGCWSAGTAAGQAGRSSSWTFLDDGDQDWEDAINASKQKKKRRRLSSVVKAREPMFAAEGKQQKLCITATRWDPADLSAHTLDLGVLAEENWAVLVLPALCDPEVQADYKEMYPGFTVLEDFRDTPGEPIWPDRRSRDKWLKIKAYLGPIIFETECQQHAKGVEHGGMFYAAMFNRLEVDPAFVTATPNEDVYRESCRAWDLAGTEGGGDWTAGVKGGSLEDASVIIRHVVRAQLGTAGVEQLIAAVMLMDGPTVKIRIPLDPAAGGIAFAESIQKYCRQVAVYCGMPFPEFEAKRPRRLASATESAKKVRLHDFQSFATPADWNPETLTGTIPGGVSFVAAEWCPAVSDHVKDYDKKIKEWPELAAISRRGVLCAGKYWTPLLQEMESFTGEDGRTDDQADATGDMFDEVRYFEAAVSAMIMPR